MARYQLCIIIIIIHLCIQTFNSTYIHTIKEVSLTYVYIIVILPQVFGIYKLNAN